MRRIFLRSLFVMTLSLAGLSALAEAQESRRCRFEPAECRRAAAQIAARFGQTGKKFVATIERSDRIIVNCVRMYASIVKIGARELRRRNFEQTGVKSGLIVVRSLAIGASYDRIDATCAETFATTGVIVGMRGGIKTLGNRKTGE